jgi:hypothetical protein
MTQENKLGLLLREEIELMSKAENVLTYSYLRCRNFANKEKYSDEEEVELEALTSRFSRLSDMLVQKIWQSIFILELETFGTVKDKINRAEKFGLLEDAKVFEEIRILRNKIAHEYAPSRMPKLYHQVLKYLPSLFDAVKRTRDYVVKKGLI